MSSAGRTAGRIAIALALESVVVLAYRADRLGLFFTVVFTIAVTAFAWPWLGHQLGRINTGILLGLVYVLGAGPMKLFGVLNTKPASGPSFWTQKPPADPAIPHRRRMQWQF